jgi:hypothetical protein
VTSKAYQRKGAPLRPLTVDQLFLSLARVTRFGLDEDGSGGSEEEMEEAVEYEDYYPPELLGGSPRSLRRALALLNHGVLHYAVDSGARFIMKTLGKPVTMEHFEHVYLALLSRRPTDAERKFLTGEKRWDLEDVLWAVINSVEFQNNH